MKKTIVLTVSVLLVFAFMVCFVSCKGNNDSSSSSMQASQSGETTSAQVIAESETTSASDTSVSATAAIGASNAITTDTDMAAIIWQTEQFSEQKQLEDALSVEMPLPENAENKQYLIISGNLAQIDFEVDSYEYTYRAALLSSGLEGSSLYGISDENFTEEGTNLAINETDVLFRTTSDGLVLATWKTADANFSLAIPSEEQGSVEIMCTVLAQIVA